MVGAPVLLPALDWSNGKAYFFEAGQYYRYNDVKDAVDDGYPGDTSAGWRGVPNKPDAALRWSNGKTYFFKGTRYWRYDDASDQVDDGYPATIAGNWKGVPNELDAAFRWSNGKTYFFKGSKYYRYDDAADRVDDGYPGDIQSGWPGVPDNIDTALRWGHNLQTYFFKGAQYYRFNDAANAVDSGYPASMANWAGLPAPCNGAAAHATAANAAVRYTHGLGRLHTPGLALAAVSMVAMAMLLGVVVGRRAKCAHVTEHRDSEYGTC